MRHRYSGKWLIAEYSLYFIQTPDRKGSIEMLLGVVVMLTSQHV